MRPSPCLVSPSARFAPTNRLLSKSQPGRRVPKYASGASPLLVCTLLAGMLSAAPTAQAFVASPTGGRPGSLDVKAAAALERGKVEPNDEETSFTPARWEVYSLAATYNIQQPAVHGLYIRLAGLLVRTPSEISPAATPVQTCVARERPDGRCEFYGRDQGSVVQAAIGVDLLHEPGHALGVFLQGSLPLGLNLDKFVQTRVDYLAAGVTTGMRLTPWLTHTSQLYLGTGAIGHQNATVALTQLFNPEFELGLPWVLHVGTYFDGDLTERFDPRYDAAYTPGYPEHRDRLRMMRFGTVLGVTVGVLERVALEVTYVQKLFGYDTPATRFLTFALQTSLL